MGTIRLIRAKVAATTIFSGGAIRDLARRDQLWVLPLALLGIAVGLGAMVFALLGNYRAIYQLGLAVGEPEIVFSFALFASWALSFFLSIPVIVSVFFFSRDTPMLLALPIRPISIVLANSFLVYASSLGAHLLVSVPAFVVYAGSSPTGAGFWVSAALYLLAGPLLPLSLAVLLAFGLTAVVNLSRYRVALEVAGFTVVLGGIIALQLLIQRSAMSQVAGEVALPAALASRLLRMPDALPPLRWAARGFVWPRGIGALALFVGLSAAAAAGAGSAVARVFFRLTVERSATRASRLSTARYRRLRAARSPTRALLQRELAVLSSNSSLLFEGVVEALVFPLILGIFSLTIPKELSGMFSGLVASSPWAGLGVLGVLALMTGFNTVSSTSISREGRTFALSLLFPLAGRFQLRAKLLFHLLIFGAGYLVDLVIVFLVLRLPPLALVYLVPGGAGFLLLSFCLAIFVDLRKPYLTWTHPQQAMKQNMNAMSAIGLTLVAVGSHAAIVVGLWALGVTAYLAGLVVSIVALLLAAYALKAVLRYADKRYAGELEAVAVR